MYLQSFRLPLSAYFETIYLLQPYDLKGYLKGVIFLSIYLFSILSVLLVVRAKNRTLAYLAIFLFALFYSADLFVQFMGNNYAGLSPAVVSLSFSEADKIENLMQFQSPIINSTLVFIGLILVFTLYRKLSTVNKLGSSLLAIGSFLISICLVVFSVIAIFSITIPTFPAPLKVPILITQYFLNSGDDDIRVLSPEIKPVLQKKYKTVVWIIDESISGDYLSINGYEKNTTPFLNAYESSNDFRNFGISTPISNCSNTSNLFLRIGLTTQQANNFTALSHSLPTIFQFAKRAGYETSLIDAQTSPGQMQNHLNAHDLKSIDDYVTFTRDTIPNKRDELILEHLNKALHQETDKNHFIVVVKWGAHWPYQLTYPDDQEVFSPAVKNSFAEFSKENKTIITNTYLNAVHYATDHFLQKIFNKKIAEEQIIFYTSDHGQSLFHNMDDDLTHCHTARDFKTLPLGEFKVPLMVFAKNAKELFKLDNAKHYNQQQLFSTTLKIMGYEKSLFEKYSPTLYEGSDLPFSESYVLDTGKRIKFKSIETSSRRNAPHTNQKPMPIEN